MIGCTLPLLGLTSVHDCTVPSWPHECVKLCTVPCQLLLLLFLFCLRQGLYYAALVVLELYIDQAGLKLSEIHLLQASQVLALKECFTTPNLSCCLFLLCPESQAVSSRRLLSHLQPSVSYVLFSPESFSEREIRYRDVGWGRLQASLWDRDRPGLSQRASFQESYPPHPFFCLSYVGHCKSLGGAARLLPLWVWIA